MIRATFFPTLLKEAAIPPVRQVAVCNGAIKQHSATAGFFDVMYPEEDFLTFLSPPFSFVETLLSLVGDHREKKRKPREIIDDFLSQNLKTWSERSLMRKRGVLVFLGPYSEVPGSLNHRKSLMAGTV